MKAIICGRSFLLIAVPSLSWFGGIVIIRSSKSVSVKIITNVVFPTGAYGGPQMSSSNPGQWESAGWGQGLKGTLSGTYFAPASSQLCLRTPVWADGTKVVLRGKHPSAIWTTAEVCVTWSPSATKQWMWRQSDKRVSQSANVGMGLSNNPGPHFPGMPPCFTAVWVACGSAHHQSQQLALACWFSYCLFCETAWQSHFCAFKKDTHSATTHIFSYGFSTTKYYF